MFMLQINQMPQFIHLADERQLKRLEKSGIRMTNWGRKIRCVYATPVLRDFQVSHQWLRELKNKGIRTIEQSSLGFLTPRKCSSDIIVKNRLPSPQQRR